MSLFKLSAKENDFVFYYVGMPRYGQTTPAAFFSTQYMMPEKVALTLANQLMAKEGKPPIDQSIVCVCIDRLTGRIYLPQVYDYEMFSASTNTDGIFSAVRKAFRSQYKDEEVSTADPICGDPTSVFRAKTVQDYPSAMSFMLRNIKASAIAMDSIDFNLPVIEANLSLMNPTVKDQLPEFSDLSMIGKYIGTDRGVEISFSTGTTSKRKLIHSAKTPFILINTASQVASSQASRESMVIYFFKNYLEDKGGDSIHNPQLLTLRYLLYSGWSIKDLCFFFLQKAEATNAGEFLQMGANIIIAAKDLSKQIPGIKDLSDHYFYYVLQISNRKAFPVSFIETPEPKILTSNNGLTNFFEIKHFDPKTSCAVVKTQLFITDDMWHKHFGISNKTPIAMMEHDPELNAITGLNISSVGQTTGGSAVPLHAVDYCVKEDGAKPPPKRKQFEFIDKKIMDFIFERKRISDFPEAFEALNKLCAKLSKKNGSSIGFVDLPVLIGPFAQKGIAGGYFGNRRVKASHLQDGKLELFKGVFVPVPSIIIDNLTHPSVIDRQYVIRHEYRHFINEIMGVESPTYKIDNTAPIDQRLDELKKYYSSPDERQAFIDECKYLIGIGMSKEQVLKHIIGDMSITIASLPVIKLVRNIILDAQSEMREESQEDNEANLKAIKDISLPATPAPLSDTLPHDFSFGDDD